MPTKSETVDRKPYSKASLSINNDAELRDKYRLVFNLLESLLRRRQSDREYLKSVRAVA